MVVDKAVKAVRNTSIEPGADLSAAALPVSPDTPIIKDLLKCAPKFASGRGRSEEFAHNKLMKHGAPVGEAINSPIDSGVLSCDKHVLRMIASLHQHTKVTLPHVLNAILSDTQEVQRSAFNALELLEPPPEAVLPTLEKRLRDRADCLAVLALDAAANCGDTARDLTPAMLPYLSDRHRAVRFAAIKALNIAGSEDPRVCEALIRLIYERKPEGRALCPTSRRGRDQISRRVGDALSELGIDDPDARATILRYLYLPESDSLGRTKFAKRDHYFDDYIKELGKLRAPSTEVFQVLNALVEHARPSVRHEALGTLVALGTKAHESLPLLEKLAARALDRSGLTDQALRARWPTAHQDLARLLGP